MRQLLIGLVIVASGCGSSGAFVRPSTLQYSKGTVYFYRPSRFAGGAITINLRIDGTQSYTLGSGECFYAQLGLGNHLVEGLTNAMFFGATNRNTAVAHVETSPGSESFIRGTLGNTGFVAGAVLKTIDPEEAKKEMGSCKL